MTCKTLWCRHEMIVMVSGGSGITPFISIIRELLVRSNHGGNKIPSILLICAFKKSEDLTMLDLVLPVSGTNFDISSLQLQIEAYVTKEKEPTTDNHKLLQTRLFKPDPSDVPISSVLGQNGWLWLGMIISTSFVIFLLLIGILTRYYIYPIDHNSNMIYSFSSKNALNMLFICVSIITTATAVFLWNKKQNAKETMQIQNTNMPIPMTHSVADDRGLESLSHQSFVQATQVHYGKRPNLKSKLPLSYRQKVLQNKFPSQMIIHFQPKQSHNITLTLHIICPCILQEYCWSVKAQALGFLLAVQGR